MTYPEVKIVSDQLVVLMQSTSKILRKFPKNSIGLTPDDVKASKEYKLAISNARDAFAADRAINGIIVRNFKREAREERRAKQ